MTQRPRLRDDLVIVVQQYRGEESYIVKDPETHKYFRFKPLEILVMQHFTGEHTVTELANALRDQGVPLSPAAVQKFAEKLSGMELIERTLGEKSTLLIERLRAERHRRVKRTHYEGSLLRMRWSAGDPDKLFDRWMPWLRFFFTPTFMVISAVLFAVYALALVLRWPDIISGLAAVYTAEFYTLQNIVMVWGTMMVIIVIHETAHGVTCKYFGGQVHEMGAMLLYFQPAFYCNVNDAWTFPKLSHRIWVTAAGSWIELVVAGMAAIVWLVVDPNTVIGNLAFFTVILGGVTTVVANANPLIPLDGYYALSDYLEVANLRQRSFGYIAWLLKRYVIRLNLPEPAATERERRIFVIYGVLAILYIVSILSLVALFALGLVSRAFGGIGVIAFVLLLWALLRTGLREWGRAIVTSFWEHRTVLRKRLVPGLLIGGGLLLLLVIVPWPINVKGRFVAAPLFEAPLAAAEGGVLERVYADEGDRVQAGAPVARLRNFALERHAAQLERVVDSLDALARRARGSGQQAANRQIELARAEAVGLMRATRERLQSLTLRAPVSGVVITPRLQDSLGLWFAAGDVVAVLAVTDSLELRLRLDRAGATMVRAGQSVALITYTGAGETHSGSIVSVSLAALRQGEEVEARVRLHGRAAGLRAGVTGEAKITIRRSNILGALWWAIRKRIRNDLLL
ncbi:MAG: HlyD family efflux transporter periplasmic adaptor subunit [Gemmatimonadetes bacterium]|nr:HlyD family efflux transporter periplasmic adaptor subunit [Gemmatimonadota bacterium]